MKEISWPQAFLLVGLTTLLIAGVVVLTLADKDVGALMAVVAAVVVPILAAFGIAIHQGMREVKDVANGRLTDAIQTQQELREENKKLQAQVTALALSLEPRATPPMVNQVMENTLPTAPERM